MILSANCAIDSSFRQVDRNFDPTLSTFDLWNMDPSNSTMGTTLSATGATPPAVTLTGTLTAPLGIRVEIQTTGALGASTFSVSINNGASFVSSGVTTIATYLIPGTATTLNFPNATYTNDNVYQATVAVGRDASTALKDASQGTAASQPFFTSANASFNAKPTWTWPSASNTLFLDSTVFSVLSPPLTYVFVCRRVNVDGNARFEIGRQAAGANGHQMQATSTTHVVGATTFTGQSVTPYVKIVSLSGTQASVWVNGLFLGTKLLGATTVTSWRIGCNFTPSATAGWTGDIARIGVSSKLLSSTTRRSVEYWAAKTYGLSISWA
jgi:hypothetical protein